MPQENREQTRRAVLGSLASAGLLGVAGCSTTSSPQDSPTNTSTTTSTTQTTTTQTTTSNPSKTVDTKVLDNFQDLSKWSVEAGSLKADTKTTYKGSQSARVQHGDGPVRIVRSVDADLAANDLSFAFRMQSSGNAVPELRLRAPDKQNQLVLSEGVRQESSGTWFRLDPGASDVAGLPDMENVKELEIRIRGGGSDTKFWLDDLRLVPSPEKGYAVLFFDDGRNSAYSEGYSVLSEHEMPATVPVVTSQVGADGYLSLDQMDELASNGWEMCSHTHSQQNLEDISRLTAEREIVNAKQWLVDHGFETGARWLAYPYGRFSSSVMNFASEYHDLAFRYMGTRSSGSARVTGDMTVSRGDGSNVDLAKRMIDLGDLYNDIELFTFHGVGSGNDGLAASRAEFEEFAGYLADSSLEVITPETLYNNLRAKTGDK